MVRTLRNAIAAKRLAHAFIMTGVRGVGKTTTARLIARALNCVGPDGTGSETIEPCGVCEFCTSIAAGSHPDVIEMDAASNTGVDDVRTIIDNVPYAAASARYKIYIIDEVHMLSRNAFNALLKTLEEPPAHVKFIFATTEIGKVPITVLSRCQRFDLKRIDSALLAEHFKSVCAQEAVEVEDEALSVIAQAAEGSVRDGLSLLDQAIAHAGEKVTADQVREMIGLADSGIVLQLLEAAFKGAVPDMLALFDKQYHDGADPLSVMEALLDMVHWLTKCRLYPNTQQDPSVSSQLRNDGMALANALSVPVLNTAWQILLKGIAEVKTAPRPAPAAEMVLIRLAYAATLPSPADLVKKWEQNSGAAPATPSPAPQKAPAPKISPTAGPSASQPASITTSTPSRSSQPTAVATQPAPMPAAAPAPEAKIAPAGESHLRLVETTEPEVPQQSLEEQSSEEALKAFEALVQRCDHHKEGMLAYRLRTQVRVAVCDLSAHVLKFAPVGAPDQSLVTALRSFFSETLDEVWRIEYVPKSVAKTLEERDQQQAAAQRERALNNPAVKRALELFPKAEIVNVRSVRKSDLPQEIELAKAPDGYDVLPDEAYEENYEMGAHPFDPDALDDL